MLTRTALATFGQFTAYHGKLDHADAREAYVEGPTLDGRIAPLASFWNDQDAIAWARKRGAPDAAQD